MSLQQRAIALRNAESKTVFKVFWNCNFIGNILNILICQMRTVLNSFYKLRAFTSSSFFIN